MASAQINRRRELEGFPITDTYINSGTGTNIQLTFANSGGATGPLQVNSEVGHPGVWRCRTTAVPANEGLSVARGTGANSLLLLNSVVTRFYMSIKFNGTPATSVNVCRGFLGLVIAGNTAVTPSMGILFYWNSQAAPTGFGDAFMRVRVSNGSVHYNKVTSVAFDGGTQWRNFEINVYGGESVGSRFVTFGYADESLGLRKTTDIIATITEAEWIGGGVTSPFSTTDIVVPGFAINKASGSPGERMFYYDEITMNQLYYQ